MTLIGAAVTVVSLLLLLRAELRTSGGRRVFKMAAATGFVVVALGGGALDSVYGRWVLGALAASWIGDLALTYGSKRAFLIGLGAFSGAHLLFAAAFASRSVDVGRVMVEAVPVIAIGAVALRWLWPHIRSGLRPPVVIYIIVISGMVVLAAGTTAVQADWRIRLGATMFYVSDLFVARNRFVTPGVANRIIGLPIYFLGQLLLAWSVAG